MNRFFRQTAIFLLFFFTSCLVSAQGLKINELMSTNTVTVFDEDNDSPDWIEVNNFGSSNVNLADYFLSDNKKELQKWQMPEVQLAPDQPFLIFASDKNRTQLPQFWYTIIDKGSEWLYILPNAEPSANWKKTDFSDATWSRGTSGIGYGDNDDNTIVPDNTLSVYLRKSFDVAELGKLTKLWFHMDFDDGFVAYLNNVEICRAGLGAAGSAVPYNSSAVSHEAKIYQGGKPDAFDITPFINLLKDKNNVLAVQVHNSGTGSSDLTAVPILSLGYSVPVNINAPVSRYIQLPTVFPHANFKLSSEGETVYLTHKSGTITDSVKYDFIPASTSFGRKQDEPAKWGFFVSPTPGWPNFSGMVSEVIKGQVQFSENNMFLSSAVTLVLSGNQTGEEIRYTDDGSEPTLKSTKYLSPIVVDKNKVIKARMYKTNALPGKSVTRTFVFDAKPTLPVVSISTNPEHLWDTENGIYVLGTTYTNQNPYYGANFWEDWEKPASVEMVSTDSKKLFSLNCGIKIFGGWSRAQPNKSLSIFFRNEYGDPVLDGVQLFSSKPITKFKSLVLRNSGNDYQYSKFRDAMMTNLVRKMDTDIQAFQPVIVYLNGEYWGVMNLREKINEDYLESNHGVNSDEIDMLQNNAMILEGDNENYLDMIKFAETSDMTLKSSYDWMAQQMDFSNFTDYQLSQIYFDNRDWPGNNIKYWRSQSAGEFQKWRWLMYDTDFGFGIYVSKAWERNSMVFATEVNGPNWPNPPWSTFLLRKLLENDQFRIEFINRFADMMNTTFEPNSVVNHIDSIAKIIEPEIQNNAKRWGNPSVIQWQNNVQIMRDFARYRVDHTRNHIKQKFSLPNIHDVLVSVLPSTGGTVLLNTIKIQHSFFRGKYFENVPIKLTASSLPGYKFKSWEVDGVFISEKTIELNLKKATSIRVIFEEGVEEGKTIAINEINYNSLSEKAAGDWVEFYNWGTKDIDISGWVFKDDTDAHGFVFPAGTILKSKDYLVVCRSNADFALVHPDVKNVLGEMDFGLSGSGDFTRLFDALGSLIDEVKYSSELPWPQEPNGKGPTLELVHYSQNNADPISWKASVILHGTPGKANSIATSAPKMPDTQAKNLNIYPNPFSQQTRIRVDNNFGDELDVSIFTVDGRMVFNQKTTDSEIIWNGTNSAGDLVQPGIYICKVKSGSSWFTGKMVFKR